MPEDIDVALKRWSLTTLPIVPKKFKTKPIEKTKKRLNELKKSLEQQEKQYYSQKKEIELIFKHNGFINIKTLTDLSGNNRLTIAQKA